MQLDQPNECPELTRKTRSMARELGSDDITVNAVLPRATDTEIERATITPAQRQSQIAMRSIQRKETIDDVTAWLYSLLHTQAALFRANLSLSMADWPLSEFRKTAP